MLGTLEEGMLDEVCHALVGPALVTRPHTHIHSRVGHSRRGMAEYYLDAVRQYVVFVHIDT